MKTRRQIETEDRLAAERALKNFRPRLCPQGHPVGFGCFEDRCMNPSSVITEEETQNDDKQD